MHTINEGIERAVLTIIELFENEAFEKGDMIYRAFSFESFKPCLRQ